ncbi:MAG: hypothetical protein ACK56I_27160, partial [bacterium]
MLASKPCRPLSDRMRQEGVDGGWGERRQGVQGAWIWPGDRRPWPHHVHGQPGDEILEPWTAKNDGKTDPHPPPAPNPFEMEARHPHTKVAALIRLGRGNGFPVDGQPEMPGPGGARREITQEVEVCVFHINGRERD